MIEKLAKTEIEKPDLLRLAWILWACRSLLLAGFRFVFNAAGIPEEGITLIVWMMAAFPLCLCAAALPARGAKAYIPFLIILAMAILSIALSVVFNPQLEPFFARADYGLARIFRPDAAIYAFLFFSLLDDPKELLKNLTYLAAFEFIYLLMVEMLPALIRGYWVFVDPRGQESRAAYSLSFGYAMTVPAVVFLYQGIRSKKWIYFLLAAVALFCILTQGNRGALLLPLLLAALLGLKRTLDLESKKRYWIWGTAAVLTILFLLWGKQILQLLFSLLQRMGISSRSIEMFISGEIGSDNGRGVIWDAVMKAIREGGAFGYGTFGDRPFVYPLHYVAYSHNIFLELTASYGILGLLFGIYLTVDAVKMIFFCRERAWNDLYIILFVLSSQLFLSMSFWYVWEFWALMAVSLSYKVKTGDWIFKYLQGRRPALSVRREM